MIKFDVKIDNSVLKARLKKQRTALSNLPHQGLKEFQDLTPKDTGNARRRTGLIGKSIVGDYPYAQRLDNNWSKQTHGQGIIKPFRKWWIDQIKRIARIK